MRWLDAGDVLPILGGEYLGLIQGVGKNPKGS
jgi:hypothetical protein